ncbi:four helix bundle protein [Eubacterium barkeri]|uniref:bAvd-like domain-containing protein n=1 Tax=Eubacterium barkeri TaxID=1528 RepID=A0A1H3BLC8_EUBBA|nr:four helix bundle protein [Eubacterium barkeri]SDX42488.1 hypothetical protein SAMN04488579_102117 [Eubacterium barkeri]
MTESRTLQKIKDMIAYANKALLHFPKIERGGMVQEIKQSMYHLLRLCIQCDQKFYKKNTLQEMSTEKEYIQSLIGIAANRDHKYLDMKKYEIWSNYLVEIGKLIGARMRAESKKS